MAASAAARDRFLTVYISSDDEDDDVAVIGASSSPEEVQIQQAILLSIDSSASPITIPSSSPGTSAAGSSRGSIPLRKGKRKLPLELPLFPVTPRGSLLKAAETHQVIDVDDDRLNQVIDLDGDGSLHQPIGLHQPIDLDAGGSGSIPIKEAGDGARGSRHDVPRELGGCSYILDGDDRREERGEEIIDGEFDCTICTETVPGIERFPIAGCAHAFCVGCVRQYIAAKVEENLLSIGCPDPGCKDGVLLPEECRHVIPPPLFQRWGAALCDMALGDLKFYCPFKDCSALLANDDPGDGDAAAAGAAVVTNVECPHCNRVFCAQCKVPWHDGVDCAEFQRLGDDERGREDLLLKKVAQEKKWQRCPKCKVYVERVAGCQFMVCRCGNWFCYLCGCTTPMNHVCRNCRPRRT